MTATMRAEIEELARQIKKSDTWDMDQLAKLPEWPRNGKMRMAIHSSRSH